LPVTGDPPIVLTAAINAMSGAYPIAVDATAVYYIDAATSGSGYVIMKIAK
jgi:hypothetical protein